MTRSTVRCLVVVAVSFIALITAMPPAVGREGTSRAARRVPRIVLSSHRVRVDQPFGISVVGADPGALVQLNLTLVTGGNRWQSHAVFSADRWGRVRLERDAPLSGDYTGVDAMGLVWSAHPAGTVATPANHRRWTDDVHLTATVNGRQIATADVRRFYLRPGGRSRGCPRTRPGGHAVPTAGTQPSSAPGSDRVRRIRRRQDDPRTTGGTAGIARLRRSGLGVLRPTGPTHLVAIGAVGVLPESHQLARKTADREPTPARRHGRIPRRRTGLTAGQPVPPIEGRRRRGTQQCGLERPARSVPTRVDSQRPAGPVPDTENQRNDHTVSLVSRCGHRPEPGPATTIPAERINGPVLLLEGRDDQLWPSPQMAAMVVSRLHALHHPYFDRNVIYNNTGHVIGFLTNQPRHIPHSAARPPEPRRQPRRLVHNLAIPPPTPDHPVLVS